MPRVTVLTVVRDGAPFLEQTLESIRRQTMTDFEYIIVDDASRDATPRIVERAAARDQRIQLLRRETPGGPFVAANEGLRHARGELIARTDADDISLPLRLHRQSAFLEARPRLSACVTWSRALDDCKGLSAIPRATASLKWLLCLGCVVVHSSLCIRRTELIARGGYRELPLAQDYDLFCELARRGAIAVVPELHVLFRRPFRRVSITRRREQDRYSEQILAEHLKAMIGFELDERAGPSPLRRGAMQALPDRGRNAHLGTVGTPVAGGSDAHRARANGDRSRVRSASSSLLARKRPCTTARLSDSSDGLLREAPSRSATRGVR